MKDETDLEQEILLIALSVQETQKQGVLDIPVNSRKEAEYLRDLAKDIINEHNKTIVSPITNVLPWIWSQETSGSPPLTENGRQNGYELRFSVKNKTEGTKPLVKSAPAPVIRTPNTEEPFDVLYADWEEQAHRKALFKAKKVVGKDLMPETVGRKVARLWARGICYPDKVELATFRMTDSKGGGPYNFFTYYSSEKIISFNREYQVQVAAFHDLIEDFGYLPEWMAFEHNESTPFASVSIDIGIKLPDGRKIFVEVKERIDQREALISRVKLLGAKGIDPRSKDRGNDPLRKSKYIVAGQPDFFACYSPEGFDPYLVIYQTDNRFTLEAADLPHVE
jgi:hypothetical protein